MWRGLSYGSLMSLYLQSAGRKPNIYMLPNDANAGYARTRSGHEPEEGIRQTKVSFELAARLLRRTSRGLDD